MFPMVYSDENSREAEVERHSSAFQYEDAPLTVLVGGIPMPIAFDEIDYIDCERVHSHRSFLVPTDFIGYNYPVRKCRYTSDIYTVYDLDGQVIERPLPAYYGEGSYFEALSGSAIAVGDDSALGVSNHGELRVGLDYVKANTLVLGED